MSPRALIRSRRRYGLSLLGYLPSSRLSRRFLCRVNPGGMATSASAIRSSVSPFTAVSTGACEYFPFSPTHRLPNDGITGGSGLCSFTAVSPSAFAAASAFSSTPSLYTASICSTSSWVSTSSATSLFVYRGTTVRPSLYLVAILWYSIGCVTVASSFSLCPSLR